jgi:hypothetical protein
MVGARRRRVKAAQAWILLLALIGCFWRTYGRAAAVHADVLVAMARKGADLIAGGRLTAETMPELTYPLERADAFVRAAAARSRGRPPQSLVALEDLVAAYRAFLDTLDRLRRTTRGEAARTALAPYLTEVEQAAEEVRAALRAEHRL